MAFECKSADMDGDLDSGGPRKGQSGAGPTPCTQSVLFFIFSCKTLNKIKYPNSSTFYIYEEILRNFICRDLKLGCSFYRTIIVIQRAAEFFLRLFSQAIQCTRSNMMSSRFFFMFAGFRNDLAVPIEGVYV